MLTLYNAYKGLLLNWADNNYEGPTNNTSDKNATSYKNKTLEIRHKYDTAKIGQLWTYKGFTRIYIQSCQPLPSLGLPQQTMLTRLSLIKCGLTNELDTILFPVGILHLDISKNQISKLPTGVCHLSRLGEFNCSWNQIEYFDSAKFPITLVYLDYSHNPIRQHLTIPSSVRELYCASTVSYQLLRLPDNIPDGLKYMDYRIKYIYIAEKAAGKKPEIRNNLKLRKTHLWISYRENRYYPGPMTQREIDMMNHITKMQPTHLKIGGW